MLVITQYNKALQHLIICSVCITCQILHVVCRIIPLFINLIMYMHINQISNKYIKIIMTSIVIYDDTGLYKMA